MRLLSQVEYVFKGEVMSEKKKAKGKVSSINRVTRLPECFGEFSKCKKKKCKYQSDCNDLELDNIREQEKKEQTKVRFKDKWSHRCESFKRFFYSLFKLTTYISWIQILEPLMMVLFIDTLMIILLTSGCLSIYFLYIRDWRMTLCSVVVFTAMAFVLDRVGENKIKGETS